MQFRNCIANPRRGRARIGLGKQAKFQRLLPHKSQLIIFMATPDQEPTPPTEANSQQPTANVSALSFPWARIIKNYGLRFGSLETKRKQPKMQNKTQCATDQAKTPPPAPRPTATHTQSSKKENPAPMQGPKRWRRAVYKIDQWIPCRLNYDAICHHIFSLQLKGRQGVAGAGGRGRRTEGGAWNSGAPCLPCIFLTMSNLCALRKAATKLHWHTKKKCTKPYYYFGNIEVHWVAIHIPCNYW